VLCHFLFFICALLTKETAIVLPFIYSAVYIVYATPRLKQVIFLFISWTIMGAAWVTLRNIIVQVPMPANLGFIDIIKNFIPAMLLYTGKAIIPVNQSILPLMRNSTVIPGLIASAILIVLWFRPGIKDKKVAGLGLFVFFMILSLPVWFSASKSGAEHYEHRLYTAMAGMMLFFSQLKFESYPKITRYAAVIIFCVFYLKTYTRMDVYKNKENFVEAGVQECKVNYIFLSQKSEIYFNQRNFLAALEYCNQAIALRPDKDHLYANRAASDYELGYYKSAVNDFSMALKLSPKPECQVYLGRALSYHKAGDHRNALKDLAITRKYCKSMIPYDVEKLITDKWTEMFNSLSKQINDGTAGAQVYFDRAQLYFDTSREQEGLSDLSKACTLAPENKEYLKQYMEHYEKQKKT
jgi:hypothetical protein